jgi:hypothetical protein
MLRLCCTASWLTAVTCGPCLGAQGAAEQAGTAAGAAPRPAASASPGAGLLLQRGAVSKRKRKAVDEVLAAGNVSAASEGGAAATAAPAGAAAVTPDNPLQLSAGGGVDA